MSATPYESASTMRELMHVINQPYSGLDFRDRPFQRSMRLWLYNCCLHVKPQLQACGFLDVTHSAWDFIESGMLYADGRLNDLQYRNVRAKLHRAHVIEGGRGQVERRAMLMLARCANNEQFDESMAHACVKALYKLEHGTRRNVQHGPYVQVLRDMCPDPHLGMLSLKMIAAKLGTQGWETPKILTVCRLAERADKILGWHAYNNYTLPSVAKIIYEEDKWGELPVLADALEDAGCDEEALMTHCRVGSHYRGCWVVDMLLGKR